MKRALLSLVVVLAACFDVGDLSKAQIHCIASQTGNCPDGEICIGGLCQAPGDLSAGPADLGGVDMSLASTCASGRGTRVGAAYACPGSFKPGQVAAQCAAGSAPCTSAAGVDLAACESLSGFFLANVVGRYPVPGDLSGVQCTGTDYYRVVYGCGNPAKARGAATVCASFAQLIDCRDINSDFQCSTPPFDDISNMTNPYPLDGVLCCKKP